MSGHGDSTRAVLVALGANLAIAITKGIAAWVTSSGAMLAETVHSFADCGNQLLLLLGMRQSKQPPTPDHPLGRGKEIYFWSFLVAIMLFTVGGVYSLYEGLHKLQHPEPLQDWWWAVGVLLFSVVAEWASTVACLKEAAKEREGRNFFQWFRESRSAELIVVIGENVAALLGLAVALAAIIASVVTGNPLWDAIGTLVIGILLIVVAIFVAIEIKAMLVGQSMDPRRQHELHDFLEARPEVGRVISLITLQLGHEVMVAVQAEMSDRQTVRHLAEEINEVERAMKIAFPEVRWSFFEPEAKSELTV